MNQPATACHVPQIELFQSALPDDLFKALRKAVRRSARDGMRKNYTTTFWFPSGAAPTNLVEQCLVELRKLVRPETDCAGMEWWIGKLAHGEKLRFHFDRDLSLFESTGRYVHPQRSSVLYLNAFRSSPTVILDQSPGADGHSFFPDRPRLRTAVEAVPNHYVVFPGHLRHGVIPKRTDNTSTRERLTLLVNYWEQRPMAPICRDYDGAVYPHLRRLFAHD